MHVGVLIRKGIHRVRQPRSMYTPVHLLSLGQSRKKRSASMVKKGEEEILNQRSSELEKRKAVNFSTFEKVPAGMVLSGFSSRPQ